jgi:O-methyltransferase involved in polyketide biosynthesis
VPPGDVVALLDVLHYLEPDEQEALVARIAGTLAPGGLVLIREADAGGGLAFLLTRLQERLSSWARLELGRRLSYRSAAAWQVLLARYGLRSEIEPMAHGTPFANVLIRARSAGGNADSPPQG